jgi:hypothetical protein
MMTGGLLTRRWARKRRAKGLSSRQGRPALALPTSAFMALGGMPHIYYSFFLFTLRPGFLTLARML